MNQKSLSDMSRYYSAIAPFYDHLWDKNYESEANYYYELLNDRQFGPHDTSVLEFACNTCPIGMLLGKRGYEIMGIDASNGMLLKADIKLTKENINHYLVLGDITRDVFPRKTSFAFCNSVHFLYDGDSVRSFFHCSSKALNDGGVLVLNLPSSPTKEDIDEFPKDGVILSEVCKWNGGKAVKHSCNTFDEETGLLTIHRSVEIIEPVQTTEDMIYHLKFYNVDELVKMAQDYYSLITVDYNYGYYSYEARNYFQVVLNRR